MHSSNHRSSRKSTFQSSVQPFKSDRRIRHERARRVERAVMETLEGRRLLSGYTISTLVNLDTATGIQAAGGVIIDSAGNLYGTGNLGGAHGVGTVFEVAKGSGSATVLASFNVTNGEEPIGKLAMDTAGNLYGTTQDGGPDGFGVVYELAKGSHAITTLATFNGPNGENPGGLIIDSAGNLYGSAYLGGANSGNDGTVFEVAKGSHSITTLASSASAARPVAELIIDSAGNLYGISQHGGASGNGSVFELAKGSSAFTTLASFDATYQNDLQSGLTADSAGNLYGTTFTGGDANSDGTVFEVVKGSGAIKTLAAFNGTNGSNPEAAPLIDSAGNLFGTVEFGGANGDGTAFELAKGSSTITLLATFNETNGTGPNDALAMDSAGNIYGATILGGSNNVAENGDGVVFELSPPTAPHYTLSIIQNFATTSERLPFGGVTMDSAGNLYGTAYVDDSTDNGAVFEVAKGSTVITILAKFNGANGAQPFGKLLLDAAGNIYGTTSVGGAHNDGTVFELHKGSGVITTLASFNGTNGDFPEAGLIADSAGNLYGTTAIGGANNIGTVFELPKGSSVITALASADNLSILPSSELVMDSAGNLYGTSVQGGVNGQGEIFKLAKGSGTISALFTFNAASGGRSPGATLIIDSAGNLYGTTESGSGLGNYGRVFELTPSGKITYLATFNGVNGQGAFSPLLMDSAGDLLGTAEGGGNQGNYGTAFEIVHDSGAVTQLATFNYTDGSPTGAIVMDSAGNIYGSGASAGENDGVVFKLSPIGSPARLEFAAQPPAGIAGAALSPAVSVEVEDASGYIESGDSSNVTLTIASGPAGATIGGKVSVAAIGGVATFSSVDFPIAGTYTLKATDGALTAGISQSFTIKAAAGAKLVFSQLPTTGAVGAALAPAVIVKVVDAFGNLASADTSTVTLVLASGPTGGTLSGTLSAKVINGFATFGNLKLNIAGTYMLKAKDGILAQNISAQITVSANSISGFVYYDSNGNGLPDAGESGLAGIKVYFDNNNDGVYDAGDSFVTTNSAGNYLFANLPAGVYRVREQVPAGLQLTVPRGGTYTITLNADSLEGANFGNLTTAAGTMDYSFGTQGSVTTNFAPPHDYDSPIAVLLQHDGKSVVVASAGPSDEGFGPNGPIDTGPFDFALTRYTAAGTVDTSYGTHGVVFTNFAGTNSTPTSAVMQTDGKVVVAGFDDNGDIVLARYTTSGVLDTTFGNHGKVITDFTFSSGTTNSIAIDGMGRIVLAGMTSGSDNVEEITVLRFQSNGTLDSTFGKAGVDRFTSGTLFNLVTVGSHGASASSVAIASDGKIVIAGAAADGDFYAARLTSAGALDATFGSGGVADISFSGDIAEATDVAFVSGGKIVLGGTVTTPQFSALFGLARLNANGTLDTTFGIKGKTTTAFPSESVIAQAMTIQLDGKILLAGAAFSDDMYPIDSSALARYTSNGILDTTFNGDGEVIFDSVAPLAFAPNVGAAAIAVQTDGRILVAGYSGGGHAGGTFDQIVLTRFFGDATAAISGTVFNDANGDGILNNGETGIAGVKIYLDVNNNGVFDGGDYYVITDAKGNYAFANLAPGTYSIREVIPAGKRLTAPPSEVFTLKLSPGQSVVHENFGNK